MNKLLTIRECEEILNEARSRLGLPDIEHSAEATSTWRHCNSGNTYVVTGCRLDHKDCSVSVDYHREKGPRHIGWSRTIESFFKSFEAE